MHVGTQTKAPPDGGASVSVGNYLAALTAVLATLLAALLTTLPAALSRLALLLLTRLVAATLLAAVLTTLLAALLLLARLLGFILHGTSFRPLRSPAVTQVNAGRAHPFPRFVRTNTREPTQAARVPLPWKCSSNAYGANDMGRYLLLWLLGVPLPILLLIWVFGGLH